MRLTVEVAATIPRSDVDLFGDDALDDPYPHLRALRDAGPIVWLDARGMYAATRHADVRRILASTTTLAGRGC